MLRLIGLILLSDKIIPALFFGEQSTQGCFCRGGYFGTHRIVLARVNAQQNFYRNTASDGVLIYNGEIIAAEMAHDVEESWP